MSQKPESIGRYEVLERVGRGGMGVLYRGRDPVLDREVAIKLMHEDFLSDDEARIRFYREARAAARLQHRNIVTIFEFAEDEQRPYMVMEFLRGRSLAQRMRAEPPLGLDEKLHIVEQLCAGLQFAHDQGIVHRDVKPANVWLQDDGTVKLLDFGIARLAASTVTRGGNVLGSLYYMAPEQISGAAIDGRADVFSAGVVLYELVGGRRPFDGESPTAIMMKIMTGQAPPLRDFVLPPLPSRLVAAVERALERDPARRYPTAGDLATDLRAVRFGGRRHLTAPEPPVAGPPAAPAAMHAAMRGSVQAAMARGRDLWGQFLTTPLVSRARTHVASWPRSWRRAAFAGSLLAGILLVLVAVAGRGGNQPAAAIAPAPALVGGAPAGDVTLESPDAAAAPRATLRVESEPPGATVRVDDADTGLTTPADVAYDRDQPPKRLALDLAGYRPVEMPISESSIERGEVRARMDRVREAPPRDSRPEARPARARHQRAEAAALQAFEDGQRLQQAGDLPGAMAKYGEAGRLDSVVPGLAAATQQVRTLMQAEADDAYRRARQYDALGRVTEAIALYERALQFFEAADPKRAVANERIAALRTSQR